jgi:hypothetical protein
MEIYNNPALISLEGLESLTTVDERLHICSNDSLQSLTELSSLNSVGGSLIISNNYALNSLSALGSLQNVNGLSIYDNYKLESLSGLDNIDEQTLQKIYIDDNILLHHCEIESICAYLALPGADVYINDNAQGCNSREEVEEACLSVYIHDESTSEDQINVYPNPVFDHVNISGITGKAGKIILNIYNSNGSILFQEQYNSLNSGTQEIQLNLSSYPAGMYFIQLQMGNQVIAKKIIKR